MINLISTLSKCLGVLTLKYVSDCLLISVEKKNTSKELRHFAEKKNCYQNTGEI